MRARTMGPAAALLLGGIAACSGSQQPACEDAVPATTVEVTEYEYAPSCVAVAADATLTVSNVGEAPHSFTVTSTDATIDVAAGVSGDLDLAGVAPGTYRVICTYHPEMQAAIKIG